MDDSFLNSPQPCEFLFLEGFRQEEEGDAAGGGGGSLQAGNLRNTKRAVLVSDLGDRTCKSKYWVAYLGR